MDIFCFCGNLCDSVIDASITENNLSRHLSRYNSFIYLYLFFL